MIEKAKYTKRTGGPGNYKYEYDDNNPIHIVKKDLENCTSKFKGKPKEAVEFLIENQKGGVSSVWSRKDVGDIDLIWGRVWENDDKKDFGLSHVIEKHVGEKKDFSSITEMIEKINDVIENGHLTRLSDRNIRIKKKGFVVFIAKTNGKHWILTSYNKAIPEKDKGISKGLSENNPFESQALMEAGSTVSLTLSDLDSLLLHHKYNDYSSENQIFDEKNIEKAKKAQIGEIREHGGQKVRKTTNGWEPVTEPKEKKQENQSY